MYKLRSICQKAGSTHVAAFHSVIYSRTTSGKFLGLCSDNQESISLRRSGATLDRDLRDIGTVELSTFLSAPVSASETSTIRKPMKSTTEYVGTVGEGPVRIEGRSLYGLPRPNGTAQPYATPQGDSMYVYLKDCRCFGCLSLLVVRAETEKLTGSCAGVNYAMECSYVEQFRLLANTP